MTQPPQPPQPPNEPPQGGFGAPQDQPPGGFGAPQPPQTPPPGQPPQTPPPGQTPPPPGPGYGYPQAPPQTPPPAQPPYGYPQQGAPGQPPYGYPQQGAPGQPPTVPAGQPPTMPAGPGYGYPQQQQPQYGAYPPPTVPMQTQGSGGGSKFGNPIVLIVGVAVLVIALIVGGGVWYASSSGGDDPNVSSGGATGGGGKDKKGGGDDKAAEATEKAPANPSAKVLFQLPAPAVPKDHIDSVKGSWLTDTVYAKAGLYKVVGYDPDSGSTKWTLPLPGETCGYSREITKDGLSAVISEGAKRNAKGDHQFCSEVTVFNVNTGAKVWTKSIDADQQVKFEEVTITGNTVAAGSGLTGGAAFDLKTGKVLWQPKAGNCQDVGYAGGEQLVAVRKCGNFDDEKYEVQLLDPTDGKVKWSYKLPAGIDNAKILSTKPVVFGVDSGEVTATGVTDVFSLDDSGKLRIKITLGDGKYDGDCEVGHVWDCKGMVVGNDKLYVATKEHDGSGGGLNQTNEIVSFSLATGKTTGDRVDAGDDYTIFPVRMDGGNVIAYKDGPYDKGSQIVSVDGSTTKATKLLETPATESVQDAVSSMVPDSAELLYHDGRLFFGKDLISKPYSADEKEYTVLGFGAAR
ncbi:outer membrane protein assembly factor BamB family protein [Streptomyces sp. NPDC002004]